MSNYTRPSILQNIEAEIVSLISKSRGITEIEALRVFLESKTHEMLIDDDMKLWHFSPIALYDMWENEVATGDPGKSFYLRGDEIE